MPSNIERLSIGVESGLIEFVCNSHEPEEHGPTVTPIRVGWGYCPGARGDRHTWRQIEPTTRERLERYVLPPRLKPLK